MQEFDYISSGACLLRRCSLDSSWIEDILRSLNLHRIKLTIYDISDPCEPEAELVSVLDTHIGKGVFAVRAYPATAIVGQITGRLMEDPLHGSEYSFEFDEGLQLEPDAPFRYVNHSCDPNCEFDLLEEPPLDGRPSQCHLYLIALRDIQPDEQITINYNWTAECAIPCECGSENCIGWVVCDEELERIPMCYVYPAYELNDEFAVRDKDG